MYVIIAIYTGRRMELYGPYNSRQIAERMLNGTISPSLPAGVSFEIKYLHTW